MDYLYISIAAAFFICFLVQLYFILVVHRKLAVFRIPDSLVDSNLNDPVSVIICARNEIENLKANLISFLEQDYPEFEIVVVNDCSNDGSDWYLRDISARFKRLKVVTIEDHPRFKHGKKFAVTLGIKAAKYENLLFTDADCIPASDQWIKLMQRNFSDQTEIVLGYSPYQSKSGILNRFLRFETFVTALNYLSYAILGDPYMGVGRNMGYKKSLFFRGKGFASHMHILSGDDDLFVNQNANATNTSIEIHPDTHIWSEPKTSISAFISQKMRHQGAGKAYKTKHKRMLSIQFLSGILFYVFLGLLLAIKADWWLTASVYGIRLLVQILVYTPSLKKLKYIDLVWFLPLFDIIYYIYIMLLSFLSFFRKKVEWK